MTAASNQPTPWPAPPNAPDYRDFRMMAEWASAIRGESLGFRYDLLSGRMTANEPADGSAPVLTGADAPRPYPIEYVELTVNGQTHRVSGTECSALFWSESSVEKFLFPTLASASADDASRFLGRLSNVWYGYPARVVQVCALAYQYGTRAPRGNLSLDASVGLLCWEVESQALRLMGLDEFERTYPAGAARGAGAPAGGGNDAPEPLPGWITAQADSVVAREAAELVSGLRGHYVRFTFDDSLLTPWVYPTEYPGAPPYYPGTPPVKATVVSEGVAVTVRPDRPYPSRVVVRLQGVEAEHRLVPRKGEPIDAPLDRTREPDSLFWTDGAVERLLLPYYASVKGRWAPYYTTILMGKWNGWISPDSIDAAGAFAALAKAVTGASGDSGDSGDSPEVYAITHLPRSEYVSDGALADGVTDGLARSPAVEHRTALLTFKDGHFRFRALVDAGPTR